MTLNSKEPSTETWGTPLLCLVPGCQQGSGYPLFKDPHLRDKYQHGPQHQPHRRLCILRPQRSRRAERLRDPHEAPGAVQEQEPQRIMGGLGEQEYMTLLYFSLSNPEVLLLMCLCVSGESSVFRQSKPQRKRILQVSLTMIMLLVQ